MSEYSRFYVNMVAPSLVDFCYYNKYAILYVYTVRNIQKSDLVQRSTGGGILKARVIKDGLYWAVDF